MISFYSILNGHLLYFCFYPMMEQSVSFYWDLEAEVVDNSTWFLSVLLSFFSHLFEPSNFNDLTAGVFVYFESHFNFSKFCVFICVYVRVLFAKILTCDFFDNFSCIVFIVQCMHPMHSSFKAYQKVLLPFAFPINSSVSIFI